MDMIIKGTPIGHGTVNMMADGNVYSVIEIVDEAGKKHWLKNVIIGAECDYLMQGALSQGNLAEFWIKRTGSGFFIYGAKFEGNEVYDDRAQTDLTAGYIMIAIGVPLLIIIVGGFLIGRGVMHVLRGYSVRLHYSKAQFRAGLGASRPSNLPAGIPAAV